MARAAWRLAYGTSMSVGTGLVVNKVTGLSLPLIGRVGSVTVDQAVITNVELIENTVGAIVGLQVDGVLRLTGGVLGTDVVTEDFTTTARVTGSGPGQCDVVTIDLGGIGGSEELGRADGPALAALDASDVRPVHAGPVSQRFLR